MVSSKYERIDDIASRLEKDDLTSDLFFLSANDCLLYRIAKNNAQSKNS
jgi:hypothetical protein